MVYLGAINHIPEEPCYAHFLWLSLGERMLRLNTGKNVARAMLGSCLLVVLSGRFYRVYVWLLAAKRIDNPGLFFRRDLDSR